MLSRRTLKQTSIAALLAVLFVVLLPAAVNASGKFGVAAALSGLAEICSFDGLKHVPESPASPDVTAHSPCVFCTSSVPVFADAHSPQVVAVVDGVPVVVGPHRAQELPPDSAATRPVSPRAPPGAY